MNINDYCKIKDRNYRYQHWYNWYHNGLTRLLRLNAADKVLEKYNKWNNMTDLSGAFFGPDVTIYSRFDALRFEFSDLPRWCIDDFVKYYKCTITSGDQSGRIVGLVFDSTDAYFLVEDVCGGKFLIIMNSSEYTIK